MICARLRPAVSGLEDEFKGAVKARNVESDTPEGGKAIADLGFESHGLVIRDADGTAIWKQADHTVSIDDVRAELTRILQR